MYKTPSELFCYFYQGELKYPKDLKQISLSYLFLDRPQDGEQAIRGKYISRLEWYRQLDTLTVLFFKIENQNKCTLDNTRNKKFISTRIWIYDQNGNFIGQHWFDSEKRFCGRDPATLRFQKGDLVQFITDYDPPRLQLGIIIGIPFSKQKASEINQKMAPMHLDESDNTYVVYSCVGEDIEHHHLPECFLFKPTGIINDQVRERLIGLLSSSQ